MHGPAGLQGLGQYSLRAIRQAGLGAAFTPLLAEFETAIAGFDENLTDSTQATAGGTDVFRAARTQWLAFVDDTMKDYVTPKMRKLPVYADFKKYGKSKLTALSQPWLLTESENLLALYHAHQAALAPALDAADKTHDEQAGDITDAQLDLAADRQAIARAQRRLKAQLELTFEEPERVYSFFDFAASKESKKARKKAVQLAAQA